MAVIGAMKRNYNEMPLQRGDIKYAMAMVVLDILAPITTYARTEILAGIKCFATQ